LTQNRFMEISCEEVWRELSNYIDGDLAPHLYTRMQQHFRGCQHCIAILDGANNVVSLLGDGRSFSLPEGFSERLRKRLSRPPSDK
jgi:putative zinc finger protein